MTLAYEPQIGTSQEGLTPLSEIEVGIPQEILQPRMRYYSERKRVRLTSKKFAGVGNAYIVWHWGFLKKEWRHALRDYINAISVAGLYIESLKNDDDDADGEDDWAQFEVIATWPEGDENKDGGRRIGFDLEFDVIQELEPLE